VLIENTTRVLAFPGELSADWRFLAAFLALFRRFAGGLPPESYHVTSIAFSRFLAAFWQLSISMLAAFRLT